MKYEHTARNKNKNNNSNSTIAKRPLSVPLAFINSYSAFHIYAACASFAFFSDLSHR